MARNGTRLADNSLRCIALPPGAGGRSEGLSEAGFYSLFAAEIVPTYAKTYAFNHSGAKVTIADIRTLDAEDIRKGLEIEKGSLDQIAGGPPYQGFSINAKHIGRAQPSFQELFAFRCFSPQSSSA